MLVSYKHVITTSKDVSIIYACDKQKDVSILQACEWNDLYFKFGHSLTIDRNLLIKLSTYNKQHMFLSYKLVNEMICISKLVTASKWVTAS